MSQANALLRELPSVDRLLKHPQAEAMLSGLNRKYVTRRCREVLDEIRRQIGRGDPISAADLDEGAILNRIERQIRLDAQPRLAAVVNATGTILHTNLGRALLPQAAIDAVCRIAGHPSNVEYDLERGVRGKRETLVEDLLVWLTGAEAATVVNNNAAAVLVAVNSIANGKEVVVSRGELVEIGGAFRIPEILAKSGALLREVGTTNRTHPEDYERAIGPNTGLLLKVHTSNYRIVGFSSDVELRSLVAIARPHGIPVMEDLGSGALVDLSEHGVPKEPVVSEQVALGADLVTFSGDKMLGGPQAGLIVGTRRWIDEISRNPLHRAVRCGKLTMAALEATLKLYQQSVDIIHEVPTLRTLTRSVADIADLGARVLPELRKALGDGYRVSLEDSTAQIGSGALPTEELPTKIIAVESDALTADRVAERFRAASPPIIGRVQDGRFLLDLRTIFDWHDVIPRWEVPNRAS
jgi:L-seryl-tRNA(Ser) seleniumtransferase